MKINGQELVQMSLGAHVEAPVGGFASQAVNARCDRFLDERGIGSGDFMFGRNNYKRGRPRKAALILDPVELRCPQCRRAHKIERGPDIPSRAETVLFPCTECLPADGTLPEVVYLDWKNAPIELEEANG